MKVILEFHLDNHLPLDAASLLPDRILASSKPELARTQVNYGNETYCLGELCRITIEDRGPHALIFTGDTQNLHRAGFGLTVGRLEIHGSVGTLAGAEMTGGELEINGDAGDGLGVAMRAGLIRVKGNAGDRTGGAYIGAERGMTGGMILVEGNAGNETGEKMRRGLVAVAGSAGELAGLDMLAGTLLVGKRLGKLAGLGMKRGSLVADSCPTLLPCFSQACCMDWVWLRLLFYELRSKNFPVPEDWLNSPFTRCTGDHTELGRGEIILHEL